MIRTIVYGSFLLLLMASIALRIHSVKKERTQEVVSVISQWEKEGRPVEILKMKKESFDKSIRLSARLMGNNFLSASVPLNTAQKLRSGMSFTGDLGEGLYVDGVVTSVGGLDFQTKLSLIQMKLNNTKDLLRFLKSKESKDLIIPMDIKVSTLGNVFKVPVSAIVKDSGKSYLWKEVEGKSHKEEVSLGLRDADDIVIEKGIFEGDEIVVAGMSKLFEGAKVLQVNQEDDKDGKEDLRGNK